jgi:hypothetical protein
MNIRNLLIACTVLTSAVLGACDKNEQLRTAENIGLSGKSFLKVYDATLSSTNVNLKVDGVGYTGIPFTYNGLFPASTTYSIVDPGTRSINISDTNAIHRIDLTLTNNFEVAKYYTVFMYDTITAPKAKIVADEIVVPTDSVSRLRFANLLHASTANVDVFSKSKNTTIFSNISPLTVTPYMDHPSKKTDTFYLRPVNTVTNVATLIFTPGEKRNYTLIARGRYGTTTGTLAQTLTLMTNY